MNGNNTKRSKRKRIGGSHGRFPASVTIASVRRVHSQDQAPRSFRLRLESGKPQYYEILVFPNRKRMLAYYFSHGGTGDGQFLAITESWEVRSYPLVEGIRTTRVMPEVGRILIYENMCRVGIVSHECTHAAIFWAKEQGKEPLGKDGEWFCFLQGELVRQFWNGWHASRVKKGLTHGN